MFRLIFVTEAPLRSGDIRADLADLGIDIVAEVTDPSDLPRLSVQQAPEIVIAATVSPSVALLEAARLLGTLAPCPFIVFTSDGDAAKITQAAASAIHAYVVNGYAKHRLLSVIQVGRARFRQEQLLKGELSGLSQRFEERKLVDRAKSTLMRSRNVGEDEAFQLLRTLAMRSRQRLGVAAQSVIDISRAGEVLNRAGQLRMISQRVVKFYAQSLVEPERAAALTGIAECIDRMDATIGQLRRAISGEDYATLFDRVGESWQGIKEICSRAPQQGSVGDLDAGAEVLLRDAENLTAFLESSGLVTSLQILNASGRQRMLTQRIAKVCCLLAITLEPHRVTQLIELTSTFGAALDYLRAAPLSSPEIQQHLTAMVGEWSRLQPRLSSLASAEQLGAILESSEKLLDLSEHLTGAYERAMQVLIGHRVGQIP